jgi:hypothetical protein
MFDVKRRELITLITRESPVAVLGLGAPLWPILQRNFLLGLFC